VIFQGASDVDRPAADGEGRFLDRLAEGRVGVAGARGVLGRGAELLGECRLGDQSAGIRTNDVDAESATAGRAFASWTELEGFLDRSVCKIADHQSDLDGIEAPIERFMRAEASALQAIGGQTPSCCQYRPLIPSDGLSTWLSAGATARRRAHHN
jgi:hypothetical protein